MRAFARTFTYIYVAARQSELAKLALRPTHLHCTRTRAPIKLWEAEADTFFPFASVAGAMTAGFARTDPFFGILPS